jgi:hypothetical protein
MRVLVYDDSDALIDFAESAIGVTFREDAKAIGLVHDNNIGEPLADGRDSLGRLIAASVVYDGFSEADCNMHIASDNSGLWLTRSLLVAAFSYPFIQCGFNRVTGLVPENNKEALKFDLNLGFKVEGLCREAMPDGSNLVILGMLRRECRFIPKENRL